MPENIQKISLGSTIFDSITKGYQIGGMALALILVGTALLLTAVASDPGANSYVCAAVGAILILAILLRFYFVDMKKAKDFRDSIKDNKDLLNSIQDTAIQMTELSSHLQSLAFKHADKVGPAMAQIRDIISVFADIPVIANTELGKKVTSLSEHEKLKGLEQMSHDIVEYTEAAKEVIEEIKIALTQLDPVPIRQYCTTIAKLDEKLKLLLKNST